MKGEPSQHSADSNTKLLGYYREVVLGYQETLLVRKDTPLELTEIVTGEVIWMLFVYWHGAIKLGIVKRDVRYERIFFSRIFRIVEKSTLLSDPIGRARGIDAEKSGVYVVPPQIPGVIDKLFKDENYYKECVKEFDRFLKEGSEKALHEIKRDPRSK